MTEAGITRGEDELLAQAEVLRAGTAVARLRVHQRRFQKGQWGRMKCGGTALMFVNWVTCCHETIAVEGVTEPRLTWTLQELQKM